MLESKYLILRARNYSIGWRVTANIIGWLSLSLLLLRLALLLLA